MAPCQNVDAHRVFGPYGLSIGADFNGGEKCRMPNSRQQTGARLLPAANSSALLRLMQMPCFLRIKRARIAGVTQFRRQCALREQLAQASRQTRGLVLSAFCMDSLRDESFCSECRGSVVGPRLPLLECRDGEFVVGIHFIERPRRQRIHGRSGSVRSSRPSDTGRRTQRIVSKPIGAAGVRQ